MANDNIYILDPWIRVVSLIKNRDTQEGKTPFYDFSPILAAIRQCTEPSKIQKTDSNTASEPHQSDEPTDQSPKKYPISDLTALTQLMREIKSVHPCLQIQAVKAGDLQNPKPHLTP